MGLAIFLYPEKYSYPIRIFYGRAIIKKKDALPTAIGPCRRHIEARQAVFLKKKLTLV
jgi:hypothetical protein